MSIVSGTKLVAPIGLQEVYSLLGVSKTGTYYDTGWVCGNSHGKINPWAKYKPTIYGSPDGGSNWWKATSGNCGLAPYLVSALSNLPDAYEEHPDSMHGWVYQSPVPGRNWCRLADFDGYNHNAKPPYTGFTGASRVGLDQATFSFSCMYAVPESTTDAVHFEDMNFPSVYFGVYLSGEMSKFATAATQSAPTVQFKTTGFRRGSYTAYPFLSTVVLEQDKPLQAGSFYTVPGIDPISFTMVSSNTVITITAREAAVGTSISWSVSVTSYGGKVTLTNNRIYLRYSNKDIWDPMVDGERYEDLPDVTVSGSTVLVDSGFFTNIKEDLFASPKIWVSMGTGRYIASVVPMTSADPGIET